MDRRQYFRQFMILSTGTGAAQAANLLSYPFLARLYSPGEFGTFALFVAASAIPAAIACGRFDLAVPTAPRWGRAAIFWLCIAICALVGTLTAGAAAVYWAVTGTSVEPALPWLLGLCVCLTGVCAAETLYLMRHENYGASASSLPVRTGGAVVVQIGLGLVAPTALSLIVGFVCGLVFQASMLTATIWRVARPSQPRIAPMRAMFRRYRKQVAVDIPSTLIAAVSLNLMTFLLLALSDARTVGFYSIGNRLAIVPLQLFNDALGQVFFQKAARSNEQCGHFWHEMKFSLLISAALSVAILLGIWLFARPFITLYLGAEWAPAADMLMLLAPMLAIRSLCMSIATTVFVLRRAHWLLIHNIANVAVTFAAYSIAMRADLSALGFLAVAAGLLAAEYALFAAVLIAAAYKPHREAKA